MSDADDQTGGSGDPNFDKPTASEHTNKKPPEYSPSSDDDNDNDPKNEDDLPSGA